MGRLSSLISLAFLSPQKTVINDTTVNYVSALCNICRHTTVYHNILQAATASLLPCRSRAKDHRLRGHRLRHNPCAEGRAQAFRDSLQARSRPVPGQATHVAACEPSGCRRGARERSHCRVRRVARSRALAPDRRGLETDRRSKLGRKAPGRRRYIPAVSGLRLRPQQSQALQRLSAPGAGAASAAVRREFPCSRDRTSGRRSGGVAAPGTEVALGGGPARSRARRQSKSATGPIAAI